MSTTLNHAIYYPAGSAAPNVPLAMQTAAESVDAALEDLTTPWVNLTLATGWSAYVGGGGYYNGLRYRRVGKNLQIQGMVKSGAAGSTIATLPLEYRPQYTTMTVNEANAAGTLAVVLVQDTVSGLITYRSGPAAPTYLNINVMIPLS